MRRSIAGVLVSVALSLWALGCNHSHSTGTPLFQITSLTLQSISGDGQFAAQSTALPFPLIVRALDQNGNPVGAGVTIIFQPKAVNLLNSSACAVSPQQTTTDSSGQAQTTCIVTRGSNEVDVEAGTPRSDGTTIQSNIVVFTATGN